MESVIGRSLNEGRKTGVHYTLIDIAGLGRSAWVSECEGISCERSENMRSRKSEVMEIVRKVRRP